MDINKIKSTLQFAIPEELYDIAPGQVVYFAPAVGLNQVVMNTLADLMRYFRMLHKDNDIKLSIVPTENELLIGTFAGRNPEETKAPYNVVISTWDTVAGFASQFFGEDVQTIVDRVPRMVSTSRLSISTKEPVVVSVDSKNRPPRGQVIEQPSNQEDSLIEVLQSRPEPGSKEEKKLIQKEENKLYALMRECFVLDIPLDIDKVKKKFEDAVNSNIDYQLIIKGKFHSDSFSTHCDNYDIFVADDEKHKLDLTAIEKAVYLSFLLFPQGIRVKESFWGFRDTCIKIYGRLPSDERCEKDDGIRNDENAIPEVFESTLRGYISTIRAEIAKKVANPKTAIEFAIEGYKDQEFGIARSTSEIRAQIKKELRL